VWHSLEVLRCISHPRDVGVQFEYWVFLNYLSLTILLDLQGLCQDSRRILNFWKGSLFYVNGHAGLTEFEETTLSTLFKVSTLEDEAHLLIISFDAVAAVERVSNFIWSHLH